MVSQIRKRFVLISILSVAIVFILNSFLVNVSNYVRFYQRSEAGMDLLIANDGEVPELEIIRKDYDLEVFINPDAPLISTSFFSIKLNDEMEVIDVNSNSSLVLDDDILNYGEEIEIIDGETGYISGYKYKVAEKKYGYLIIFVDYSRDLALISSTIQNSIIYLLLELILFLILLMAFSKKLLAPVVESYKKQREFITNASHELKTPLAIMNTNADVLEMEHGKNKWTSSMKNQISRLSELIDGLITLTRMNEVSNDELKLSFSLSKNVNEVVEQFSLHAKEHDKQFDLDVDAGILLNGDEQSIRKLIIILIENALKYSEDNSEIKVSLKQVGKRKVLKVINVAPNLKVGKYDVLFERFYRSDDSRNSQTDGYGIGLSIAKQITLNHRGKISAESLDGKSIIFTVLF